MAADGPRVALPRWPSGNRPGLPEVSRAAIAGFVAAGVSAAAGAAAVFLACATIFVAAEAALAWAARQERLAAAREAAREVARAYTSRGAKATSAEHRAPHHYAADDVATHLGGPGPAGRAWLRRPVQPR